MMTRRITKITVETHEILFMHYYGSLRQNYCPECRKSAAMLGMEEVVQAGIDVDGVCQKAETNGLHLVETTDGLVFMCLNSLLKLKAKE
jgi:hypothetical protein